jgi:hypothetical protein
MKAMNTMVLSFLAAWQCSVSGEEPTKATVYDVGSASLKFTYPAAYVLDPKSHQGEAKWWARMTSPMSDLAIEVMSHGYCSERLREEGFKTPGDYVLRRVCGANPERRKFDGYDRLISRSSSSVNVVFLRHGAAWGRCFQQMTFSFPEGALPKLSTTIDQIIGSALPSFAPDRHK